jgi:hypothetical protein
VNGPPKKERAAPNHQDDPNQRLDDHQPDAHSVTDSGDRAGYDRLAGNARRFAAKRRMEPLPPCGCIRDPEYDRHRCGGEISDHMAQAAVSAIEHLDELGVPALLDRRTCQAVWRFGHRKLAVAVHRRTAGAA